MNTETTSIQNGAVVVIDLDDVSLATVAVTLPQQLRRWLRSPDIYALVLKRTRAAAPDPSDALSIEANAALLKLLWSIECFPKPLVSLLNAPLTPLDISLCTLGTHRVGGEAYRLAIPAPSDLSWLPAAGVAYALARLSDGVGADLVETGRAVAPREAYAAGLLTHTIPAEEFPRIIAALADGQPVDPLLDGLHREIGASNGVSPHARAAGETSRTMSTEAVLRLVADARAQDVRESLIATYRLAVALRSEPETARARIDLSRQPNSGDLALPPRSDFENGRF